MVSFCGSYAREELIENVVGAFFMSRPVETGFVETKSEVFGRDILPRSLK